MKQLVYGGLFFTSLLFIFSGIYGICSRSSHDSDTPSYAMGIFIILLGAIVFNVWRAIDGGGSVQSVLIMTVVISIPCVLYGLYVDYSTMVIDLERLIVPPVVSGYNGEGYMSEKAYLDPDKVSELLDGINNDKRKAQLEYILERGSFRYTYYVNWPDFDEQNANELTNGNEIHYSFVYDQTLAEKFHFRFDTIYFKYPVEGLEEKPEKEWEISESQLMEIAIIHCQKKGYYANHAEVKRLYEDGRKVSIRVSFIEDGIDQLVTSYTIDRVTLQAENASGRIIDFTEDYYEIMND